MCTVRSPKPQASSSQEKKPQYLTNPFLDSALYRQAAIGRNALRIDPGTPMPSAPTTPPPYTPPPVDPRGPTPVFPGGGTGLGIGGGSRGGVNTRYQML